MKHSKAQTSMSWILKGLVTSALFFSIIVYFIVSSGNIYDTTGFDEEEFSSKYVFLSQVESDLSSTATPILQENVDGNLFDVFGQLLNKGLNAAKAIWNGLGFITNGTGLMFSLSSNAMKDLQLPQFWAGYISAIIIISIVIGLYIYGMMIKVKP